MLPPGYLTFASIAPCTQPTNDGRSDYKAGFANPNPNPNPNQNPNPNSNPNPDPDPNQTGYADGHAKAVAAMTSRLEWLSQEWRAQQSVVQQIFVQARRRPTGCGACRQPSP